MSSRATGRTPRFHHLSESLLGERITRNRLTVFHAGQETGKTVVDHLSLGHVDTPALKSLTRDFGEITFCSFTNVYTHFWGEIDSPERRGERVGVSFKGSIR